MHTSCLIVMNYYEVETKNGKVHVCTKKDTTSYVDGAGTVYMDRGKTYSGLNHINIKSVRVAPDQYKAGVTFELLQLRTELDNIKDIR